MASAIATPPPARPAANTGGNGLMWIVYGVMLVAAAGAILFFATRDHSASDVSADLGDGVLFEHPNFGYKIQLPAGFKQVNNLPEPGFVGEVNGKQVTIATFGQALGATMFTKKQIETALTQFAEQRGCTIEHSRWRRLAGTNAFAGDGECPALSLRYQFASYKTQRYLALVTLATAPGDYRRVKSLRKALFRDRVTIP